MTTKRKKKAQPAKPEKRPRTSGRRRSNAPSPPSARAMSSSSLSSLSSSSVSESTAVETLRESRLLEAPLEQATATQLVRVMDPDLVRIYVGPGKKLYIWHRQLVARESPTMARKFDQQERDWERFDRNMPLMPTAMLSAKVEIVELVTQWLYNHDTSLLGQGHAGLFDLYICVVKLGFERLQNQVMDELQKVVMRAEGPKLDVVVRRLIQFTIGGDRDKPMRAFLLDLAAVNLRHAGMQLTGLGREVRKQLLEHPALVGEIVLRIEEGDIWTYKISWDCRRRYHKHENGGRCECMGEARGENRCDANAASEQEKKETRRSGRLIESDEAQSKAQSRMCEQDAQRNLLETCRTLCWKGTTMRAGGLIDH